MINAGYYLLYGVIWLISLIPFPVMYVLSDLLFLVNFYVVGYRKKVVFRNLRKAFPEKTPVEIRQLAKRFYRHFSDFIVEFPKMLTMGDRVIDKRMHFADLDVIEQLAEEKKDIALVAAHYNNWEWMAFFPPKVTHKFLPIYRPLQSRNMDRLTRHLRDRKGAILVAMEQVFREALKYRRENKLFSVYFLADQRPPRTSRFWTTFLSQEVAFFEGMEKLSRKLGLAVVFMEIHKVKRGHYEARFTKLFDDASITRENEVMLRCIHEMERLIREQPEYWLWSHNRFKHARPEGTELIRP